MPGWLMATIILSGLFFLGCQALMFGGCSDSGDSYTYFGAWENLKYFHPNQWRPPVYTIILGVATEIFDRQTALLFILILQWAVYLWAVTLLWDINRMLNISRKVNCVAIIAMMLPGFWVMNNIAVAESLCTSGVIYLVWLCGRLIESGKKRYLYLGLFLIATLIFTKPVFIILIPVMGIVYGIICHNNHHNLKVVMASILATVLLIVVYGFSIKKFYNVFGLTRAATDNMYYCLREDGLIIPDEIDDPSLREQFRPMYEKDPGRHSPGLNLYRPELYIFSWPEKKQLADRALKLHPWEALGGTFERFGDAAMFSQFLYPEPGELPYTYWYGLSPEKKSGIFYPFQLWLYFPIYVGWVIWLCFTILWCYKWHRQKVLPVLPCLISMLFFTGSVISIAGAQDSWGRLLSYFNPMLVIMAASVVTIGRNYVKKSLS